MAVRVTVEDLETGESESAVIEDDYILTCAGSCYLHHTNVFAENGTHVLTVKGRKDATATPHGAAPQGRSHSTEPQRREPHHTTT